MNDNIKLVKKLREDTGCSLTICKKAIEYSNGNYKIAVAYVKAKTLAVATPNMTFDERVKEFIKFEELNY